MITLAKLRHLSRCSTPNGHFVILALDHRTNLWEDLQRHAPAPLTEADFIGFKQQVLRALTPEASGVLTDPAYGIGYALADGIVDGRVGLLAPVEVTDYALHPSQRTLQYIPDWSVEKIKRVGADGVKLLLPYHPDAPNVDDKHSAVAALVEQCHQQDIPFFLEPIAYSPDPTSRLPNADLLRITVAMVQRFSAMGVDVLKLQFPVDAAQSTDRSEWQSACEQVNAACGVPWALLSGGVDFETFLAQTQIACSAGASGVIVGRAVWAEAVAVTDAERADFLHAAARERMAALARVCAEHAHPWRERVTAPVGSSDWYL